MIDVCTGDCWGLCAALTLIAVAASLAVLALALVAVPGVGVRHTAASPTALVLQAGIHRLLERGNTTLVK